MAKPESMTEAALFAWAHTHGYTNRDVVALRLLAENGFHRELAAQILLRCWMQKSDSLVAAQRWVYTAKAARGR